MKKKEEYKIILTKDVDEYNLNILESKWLFGEIKRNEDGEIVRIFSEKEIEND